MQFVNLLSYRARRLPGGACAGVGRPQRCRGIRPLRGGGAGPGRAARWRPHALNNVLVGLIGGRTKAPWDQIAIMEYPGVDAFVDMIRDPDYQRWPGPPRRRPGPDGDPRLPSPALISQSTGRRHRGGGASGPRRAPQQRRGLVEGPGPTPRGSRRSTVGRLGAPSSGATAADRALDCHQSEWTSARQSGDGGLRGAEKRWALSPWSGVIGAPEEGRRSASGAGGRPGERWCRDPPGVRPGLPPASFGST